MWYFELTGEEDFACPHVIEVLMEIHKNRHFNYFCFVLLRECALSRTHFGENTGASARMGNKKKRLIQRVNILFLIRIVFIIRVYIHN